MKNTSALQVHKYQSIGTFKLGLKLNISKRVIKNAQSTLILKVPRA